MATIRIVLLLCLFVAMASAINCEVGGWTNWSPCTQPCGGGKQIRFRHVTVPPSGKGATDCPELSQQRACNEHPCGSANVNATTAKPVAK
eukprot:TRINITY_DN1994_c0_g1_i1.p1 TRINITY_DN1994_c0_g1~~TRINITY_DN1994_c0_g1_i1.p1  ORF type:complete len:100 (+),score=13.26 TRINITY_DN1994_c0_g1_i1:33-302(+)